MTAYYYAALSDNNVVIGISQLGEEISSPKLIPILEFDYSLLNKIYVNGEFIQNTEPVIRTIVSKLEYMNRFSDSELELIYTAAKTNIQVEVWLEKFKLAQQIDLTDPRIRSGLLALESAGLIAQGRSDEILA